jgi:hypothetical protein
MELITVRLHCNYIENHPLPASVHKVLFLKNSEGGRGDNGVILRYRPFLWKYYDFHDLSSRNQRKCENMRGNGRTRVLLYDQISTFGIRPGPLWLPQTDTERALKVG